MKITSTRTRTYRTLAVLIVLLTAAAFCFGQQRLLVIGGGERPNDAMKKFVEWSGGRNARLLMITWASGVPDESFASLEKQFSQFEYSSIVHAATRPLHAEKRAEFIEQLRTATGVFLSGGDQNRIMDVLADEELLKLIRQKYAAGTPFGGTSAGAAVMSDPMMTGETDLKILDGAKVGVRHGLGFIPNVMFDQHFLVRQRHNRLIGFVLKDPEYLGIGIDEDTAVLIEDNRKLTVVGTSQVMFLNAQPRDAVRLNILKPGERFDLKKRKSETRQFRN
ncbi:MAG: cyanophycinase [Pyrinomonadaceae bacterium]